MEYYDLEEWLQEEEQYLIHLHFEFSEEPLSGGHVDFEHAENFGYEQSPYYLDQNAESKLITFNKTLGSQQAFEIIFARALEGLVVKQ